MSMPPEESIALADLAATIVARLPVPAEPRAPRAQAPPIHAHRHPLVLAVLAAFPGAAVVDVRTGHRTT